jgi:hypothetical protein
MFAVIHALSIPQSGRRRGDRRYRP